MENQFQAKVTALSAVSEQGELQFWLLCISTSITIFLWGWARWRPGLAIFTVRSGTKTETTITPCCRKLSVVCLICLHCFMTIRSGALVAVPRGGLLQELIILLPRHHQHWEWPELNLINKNKYFVYSDWGFRGSSLITNNLKFSSHHDSLH